MRRQLRTEAPLTQMGAAIAIIVLAAWRLEPGGLRGFESMIRLSWPGIATAGATMSSFAALPQLFTLPFIRDNQDRRSVLNLEIALNKVGATAYLAAAGGFIVLLSKPEHLFTSLALVLVFSVLTPMFAAGVPFAAVFALGMVLHYTAHYSGPAWWVLSIEPLLDPVVTMVNVVANLVASGWVTPETPYLEEAIAA